MAVVVLLAVDLVLQPIFPNQLDLLAVMRLLHTTYLFFFRFFVQKSPQINFTEFDRLIEMYSMFNCTCKHFFGAFLVFVVTSLATQTFFMSTRLVWAGSLNLFSLAYCQNQPNKGSIGFKYEIHFIVSISHKLSMQSINCFKWRIFHQCHTVMYKVTNTISFIKFC